MTQDIFCYQHPDCPTSLLCHQCNKPICDICATHTSVGYLCSHCFTEIQNKYDETNIDGYLNPFQVPFAPVIVTYVLIGIIVVIFFLEEIVGDSTDPDVLIRLGATFGPLIILGEVWRLFTAMFLHIGLTHLAFNGFALYILGRDVEALYGQIRFVIIYILSGLFGNVVSFLYQGVGEFSAGASGAVFGMVGVNVAFFYFHRKRLGQVGKARMQQMIRLIVLNLVIGFSISNINNIAHLGGLVAGCVMGYALVPRYRFIMDNKVEDLGSIWKQWGVVVLAVAVLGISTFAGIQYWTPSLQSILR